MKQLSTFILGLLFAGNCIAQTDSLTAYVETAMKNNPTVQQKWSEYKASVEKLPQVASLPDPELNMGFFLKPMALIGGNQVAELQLMQQFPWFGVLQHAKDEMSLMAKALYASLESTKLDVAYEIRSSWYELYRNRQQAAVLGKNLDLLQQVKRLATTVYQSGTGNNSTAESGGGLSAIYSIQLEEKSLINQQASLDDAYGYLAFRFNTLLNRPDSTSIVLPASDVVDPLQLPSDSALNRNPLLTMLEFEKESLEARKKMGERMGYPMVGVGLKYSVLSKNASSTAMMNGQDMLMPMVSVSLPINRKKYKASVQETVWQQSATAHNYEATRNSLQADFKEALFHYRDALRQIQLAESQQQLISKMHQLQLSRFAASTGSLEELLRISRQLLDYSLQLKNARIDLLIAQAKIRQLAAIY